MPRARRHVAAMRLSLRGGLRPVRRLASLAAAPASLKTADFIYDLPESLIAQEAAEPRDAARLLVALPNTTPFDATFARLPSLLPSNARLVLNESAVFSARLRARPSSSSEAVEVMLLGPDGSNSTLDAATALTQPADGQSWRAMVRLPLDKTGDQLIISDGVSVRVEELLGTWEEEGEGDGVEAVVRFETSDAGSTLLSSLFDDHGETPLPPYIRRAPRPEDRTRYQSVFANTLERAGSVAAPTAGLHFTRRLLGALESNGVATSRVALHVSAGTRSDSPSRLTSSSHLLRPWTQTDRLCRWARPPRVCSNRCIGSPTAAGSSSSTSRDGYLRVIRIHPRCRM